MARQPVDGYPAEDIARLLALGIDLFLASSVISLFYLIAAILNEVPIFGFAVFIIAMVVNAVVGLGYLPFFYIVYGASPGKAMMGLRIVDSESSCPAAMEAVAIRGLIQVFFAPVFLGAIYWWKYLDNDGQTVHDKVVRTKVIVVTNPSDSALTKMRSDLLAAFWVKR